MRTDPLPITFRVGAATARKHTPPVDLTAAFKRLGQNTVTAANTTAHERGYPYSPPHDDDLDGGNFASVATEPPFEIISAEDAMFLGWALIGMACVSLGLVFVIAFAAHAGWMLFTSLLSLFTGPTGCLPVDFN